MASGTECEHGGEISPDASLMYTGLAVDMCLLQWIRIRLTWPHETYQPQCHCHDRGVFCHDGTHY